MKSDAAIVVLLACGCEIEVGERDSARVSRRQVKERRADDGVISDFELVTVFEDEKRRSLRRFGIGRGVLGILNGMRLGDILHGWDVGPGA